MSTSSLNAAIAMLAVASLSVFAATFGAGATASCADCHEPAAVGLFKANADALERKPDFLLDKWTSADGRLTSPLTQIVQITGIIQDGEFKPGVGTAWFTADNRLVSVLHVPLSIKHDELRAKLEPQESLVGGRVVFEATDRDGNKHLGQFAILAHGQLVGSTRWGNSREDILVGYDPEHMSEKYRLGSVRMRHESLRNLLLYRESPEKFFTAGYTRVPEARNSDGSYSRVVDQSCQLVSSKFANDDYLVTDCFGGPGGSGSPLLRIAKFKGETVKDQVTGGPVLLAYGIYQVGGEEEGTNGFGSFYDLPENVMAALSGPVDLNSLPSNGLSKRNRPRLVGGKE